MEQLALKATRLLLPSPCSSSCAANSVATLASSPPRCRDACKVLHQKPGTDPAAAQVLQDVLQPNAEHALPPSILARLLGPKLEAEALQALALGR